MMPDDSVTHQSSGQKKEETGDEKSMTLAFQGTPTKVFNCLRSSSVFQSKAHWLQGTVQILFLMAM
jgi:hypothetical protein